jgi:SpoIIAA-like
VTIRHVYTRRAGRARRRVDMIKLLGGMPAGVLGLQAIDDVEEEDYRDVMVPAVEAAIAEHGKVRLVFVLGPEFDEFEGDAVWEDLKLGVRHPASFERMAIVTDARWAGPAIRAFSVLWPGQAHAFRLAELEAAKRWAAEAAA